MSTACSLLGESKKTIVAGFGPLESLRETTLLSSRAKVASVSPEFRGSSVIPISVTFLTQPAMSDRALLLFFGSECACGMENQGIVFHRFLLSSGSLGNGLRSKHQPENNGRGERERPH